MLQFDVLTARPVAEYDLRTRLNGASTIAARWLQADDRAELDRLHTKNPSASATRADGTNGPSSRTVNRRTNASASAVVSVRVRGFPQVCGRVMTAIY